ncbi:ABC transporter permease [candidate division KSB1 bacterium]
MNRIETKPPFIAKWILKNLTIYEEIFSITHDIDEEYEEILTKSGRLKSWLWYWFQTLKSTIYYINLTFFWSFAMFKNYLKLSYRSLQKNKLFSIITLIGFSAAIGAAISIFVIEDLVFDFNKCHKNADKIYLVTTVLNRDGDDEKWSDSPIPLGPALKADFPQVKYMTRIADISGVMKYGDEILREKFRFVDKEFLDMFTFPLKTGTKQALSDKKSIILYEDIAIKYFGNEDPIGKQVTITFSNGNTSDFTVGAVAEKFPVNAGFGFGILIPYENLVDAGTKDIKSWKNLTRAVFVQIDNPDEIKNIESRIPAYLEIQNRANPDWRTKNFIFTPLLNLTFNREIRNSITGGWGTASMIVFGSIGLFLLLLACFNYMNIAISTAFRRLKEIGIRKVLGSERKDIIMQFLYENIFLCFLALIIGTILAQLLYLPVFCKFLEIKDIESIFIAGDLWIFLPVLLFLISICAGAYPAFYISSFQPVNILRGKYKIGGRKLFTRISIIFQFIFTFILITLSVVVARNAEYQKTIDWGYDQEQIITVPVNNSKYFSTFREEIKNNPDIISIAGTEDHIGRTFEIEIIEYEGKKHEVMKFEVGSNYLEIMKIRLISGELFNPQLREKSGRSVIINQEFLRYMNWENTTYKYIEINNEDYRVAGVVEDFHYQYFFEKIRPVILRLTTEDNYKYLITKVKAGRVNSTSEFLKKTWKKLIVNEPYGGFFQDDIFALNFKAEEDVSILFSFYALNALIISCLGLFGLASVNISKRKKEIGIRKVHGAGVFSLLKLVNKEFLVLIVISSVIATPVSYLLVKSALEAIHDYFIPITAVFFIFTFIVILVTSILSISSLLYKAANTNPVNTIRNE